MLKPEMPTLAPPITWKTRLARLASTPQAWPGTGITGVYSPATTLVGAIRGIDPSRNFEILHLSLAGGRSPLRGRRPHGPATRVYLEKFLTGGWYEPCRGADAGRVGGASAGPSIDQHRHLSSSVCH